MSSNKYFHKDMQSIFMSAKCKISVINEFTDVSAFLLMWISSGEKKKLWEAVRKKNNFKNAWNMTDKIVQYIW